MANRYTQVKDIKNKYTIISPTEPEIIKPTTVPQQNIAPKVEPITPKVEPITQTAKPKAPMFDVKGNPIPESTLSQGTTLPEKEPASMWNKIARTLLPKAAEDYFGLNDNRQLTPKEEIMQNEADKQYEFAGGKSAFSGFVDSMTDIDTGDIPYYGSGKESVDNINLAISANRFEKGEATDKDKAALKDYYKKTDEEAIKRKNTGYNVGEILKTSGRFMAELVAAGATELLTLGAAPTGDAMVLNYASKLGVKKTVDKYIKDKAFRTALNTATKNTLANEAKSLAIQFGITAPTNIPGSAAVRTIGSYDLDTGEVLEPGQPINEAVVNAISQHAVELLTEKGGGVTGKLLGKMATPVKNIAVKTSIYQALKKALPKATDSQVTTILNKLGYNGVLGEFWEERDADALNQLLFKMGLGDQEFQGLTKEQVTSELIAFTIMGGAVKAGTSIYEKAKGKKEPTTQAPVNREIISQNVDETQTPSISYEELPDEAKGALQTQTRVKITNEGVPMQEAIDEMNNKRFAEIEQNISDLQQSNPDTFSDNFTKRGSMTEGPILINSNGEIIDGNNRAREAFERGETTIKAFVEQSPDSQMEPANEEDYWKDSFPVEPGGLDMSKSIGDLGDEYKETKPGQKNLHSFVDQMVESKTIHPEEAPIIKALFADTNDDFLNLINFAEDENMKKALGTFRILTEENTDKVVPESNILTIQKGHSLKYDNLATDTFVHEFGHAGYFLLLSEEERAEVDKIYNSKTEEENRSLFSHNPNKDYYARDAQEFFAQSFADYVMENKVSDKQMESILKRFAKRLFEVMKKLVERKNPLATSLMAPLYEKVLAGDNSTPFTEFASSGGKSFKEDLKVLFNKPAESEKKQTKLFVGNKNEKLKGLDVTKKEAEEEAVRFITERMESLEAGGDIPPGSFELERVDVGGSRLSGEPKEESDLDIRVFYNGDLSEDEVWDILRDVDWETGEPMTGDGEIGSFETNVDWEPVKIEKTTKKVNLPVREADPTEQPAQTTGVPVDSIKQVRTNIPVREADPTEQPAQTTGVPVDGIRQVEDKSPEGASPIEEEISKKGNTPLEKRVRRTDALRTPWKVLDKIGLRDAYQTLLTSYENYVTELPGNIDKITAWSKMVGPESNERIFRYLDGEAVELMGEEKIVAKEIQDWLSDWADRLGMKPDERISSYITHIFPISSKGEIPEELAVLINKKMAKSVYNPFLLQRYGKEGYLKDTWKALDAYAKRATRKVNMDPALAAFDEQSKKLTDVSQQNYVERYVARLNMRPTEQDIQWDNEIKSRFGYFFGARPVNNITRIIRQTISRAKIMGSIVSFAKNLTQGVNTFAELGTRYTINGYMSLLKKGGGAELKENNVMMGSFVEDRTYNAVKKAMEIVDKVGFLNMEASENINRGAAYFGAKAKFAAGKTTPREFREALGREMPANYEPTMEDAIAYGKFVAGKTQFRFDPLETPMALSSDIAKTFAQFQTFGLKQAEFILGMVNNKDKAKLARYILSSTMLFQYIGGAFGMSWDDSFKTMRWGMPPFLQFLDDLWKGGVLGEDKYGNKLDMGQRGKLVGKSLFTNVVPMGAQIQRTFQGVGAVNEGKSRSKSGRFEYNIDQTPQNYVRGALFGKYNLPEAREYYEGKEDKKKKKPTREGRYNSI